MFGLLRSCSPSAMTHGNAQHNNMEHLALMEKCVGMFPSNMLSKAPRTREFFDANGKCKGAVECDAENRRHIRRMKRLQVSFRMRQCTMCVFVVPPR